VSSNGRSHLSMLLPALERGLFHANWRLRHASVQLLGDLLYLLGNTKVHITCARGMTQLSLISGPLLHMLP